MHRGLGVVEEHETTHAEACQLAAQFGADAARAARHHHGLAAEGGAYLVERDVDFGTAQKVLYPDAAHGTGADLAAHHLLHRGGVEHLDAARRAVADQAVLLDPRVRAVGEDQGIDLAGVRHGGKLPLAGDTVDVLAGDDVALVGVAEYKEARHVVLGALLHGAHEGDGLVVSPVDEHGLEFARALHAAAQQVVGGHHRHAQQHEDREREQAVDDQQPGVVGEGVAQGGVQQHAARRGRLLAGDAQGEAPHLAQVGVADHGVVGLQKVEAQADARQAREQPLGHEAERVGDGMREEQRQARQ